MSIALHRKDVTSAKYFLVWHCGMSIDGAEALLATNRSIIKPLAEAGRSSWKKCERALIKWIDSVERKRKARSARG